MTGKLFAVLQRLHHALLLVGIDLRLALSLRYLPRYWSELRRFRKAGGLVDRLYPVLSDYRAQAGSGSGHYFHQDLLVARFIYERAPRRHIDVGSRIDGFVAHVAAFRMIEVIDIRPLRSPVEHRIHFLQGNLMELDESWLHSCDSLSCLHAIEHFGLGRYGDPLAPEGHLRGFNNLARMLEPGGILYLGVPIGARAVHFNAHRVFDPTEILQWAPAVFELVRFDYVDDAGNLVTDARIEDVLPLEYGCGIYTLRRCIADSTKAFPAS
jgi:hypothetical protein